MSKINELRARIPHYLIVTIISWVGRLVAIICSLISINLVTSCLGIKEYSIYSILISIISWMAIFDLGLGYALQNFITELKSKNENYEIYISTTFILLSVFFLLIIIGLYLLSPILSQWLFGKISILNKQELSIIFFLSTFIGIISIYGSITSKIFYGFHKGHVPNILLAVSGLFSLGLILLVKKLGIISITTIIISTTLTPALINIIPILNIIRIEWNLKKIFCLEVAKRLLNRGISFGGFAVMSALVLQVDYIVMSQFVKPEQIVEYNFLFKLYSVLFIAYSTLLSSLWPTFSNWRSMQQNSLIFQTLRRYIFLGILTFILFTIFVSYYGQDVANILLKIRINISLSLILLFGFYFCIRVWTDMFAMVLQSINQLKPFWIITPIQAVISVFLQFILAEKIGVNGILIAIILSFLLSASWALPLLSIKRLKI